MEPIDELRWNQIEQSYAFLQFIGTQGMVWFAFGCTINATVAWALLEGKIVLRTHWVHYLIIFCDLLALIACLYLANVYVASQTHIERLLSEMTVAPQSVEFQVSVFPVDLFRFVSYLMALTYLAMMAIWILGIRMRSFPFKKATITG